MNYFTERTPVTISKSETNLVELTHFLLCVLFNFNASMYTNKSYMEVTSLQITCCPRVLDNQQVQEIKESTHFCANKQSKYRIDGMKICNSLCSIHLANDQNIEKIELPREVCAKFQVRRLAHRKCPLS